MENLFHLLFGGGCGEHGIIAPIIGDISLYANLALFQIRVTAGRVWRRVRGVKS